jgi:hypothetical protein
LKRTAGQETSVPLCCPFKRSCGFGSFQTPRHSPAEAFPISPSPRVAQTPRIPGRRSLSRPLMAWGLGGWRIAADLKWTGAFAITDGMFSHWQVWMPAGRGEVRCILLHRYAAGRDDGGSSTGSLNLGCVPAEGQSEMGLDTMPARYRAPRAAFTPRESVTTRLISFPSRICNEPIRRNGRVSSAPGPTAMILICRFFPMRP